VKVTEGVGILYGIVYEDPPKVSFVGLYLPMEHLKADLSKEINMEISLDVDDEGEYWPYESQSMGEVDLCSI
jgi:hypothetical protein